MSKFMSAAETVAQLRKWGVQAKYYPGWDKRGRPGAHTDARGIMNHHTGSDAQSDDYNNFLFVRGRPEDGIPGPLCNVATEMDGDVIVGAVGRANHAGRGSSKTLDIVSRDAAPLTGEIKPGPDNVDGNAHYYGNEIKYDGGQPPTAKALRSSLLWNAAVCDFHDWGAGAAIGHREHSSRKNDPGKQNMGAFRTQLAAILSQGHDPREDVVRDVTITRFCINTLLSGKGVSGECLTDNYQIMNIAAFFYPKMAETTRPAFWAAIKSGDWKRAAELQAYALKIIQSSAKIKQTGAMDELTAKFLRTRSYTVL